jgi:sulfite exporter TauE/SafE
MTMNAGYLLSLTAGFLGGFGHCIGMCGPLVASSSLHSTIAGVAHDLRVRIIEQVLYNAGRITTYGVVGSIMGFAASFVNVASKLVGIQNGVMMGAGIMMVILGLGIAGVVGGTGWIERHNSMVMAMAKKTFNLSSRWKFYLLGLVMGLMPCGLSYTAFIAAAGTGSSLGGVLTMLFFGAGTVPALILFSTAVTYLGSRMRLWLQKSGGVAVMIMGFYYILRGMQLYAQM